VRILTARRDRAGSRRMRRSRPSRRRRCPTWWSQGFAKHFITGAVQRGLETRSGPRGSSPSHRALWWAPTVQQESPDRLRPGRFQTAYLKAHFPPSSWPPCSPPGWMARSGKFFADPHRGLPAGWALECSRTTSTSAKRPCPGASEGRFSFGLAFHQNGGGIEGGAFIVGQTRDVAFAGLDDLFDACRWES